jgi:PAS domain S-box-containing protein
MTTETEYEANDLNAEITAEVRKLHASQRRLQELTVGEVDAVVHPGGHAYLLHKAQEQLQQNEVEQRHLAETQISILNALPAQIALLDSLGVIVSVNEAWRLFATSNELQGPEFFVGQNYLEVCERASGDCSEEAHAAALGIRQVLQGEVKDFAMEYPCHSPTKQRWFHLRVAPVHADCGTGVVVMHIDITERKLTEGAFRDSEERFRSVFTAAATGIAISTPQGRFLEANAAYCKMLGYTEDELRGLTLAALTHPDDLTLDLEKRNDVMAGQNDSFAMEKRYLKRNGDIVWTSHSVSASRGTGGEIVTFVVVAEDITERKLAEEQLLWKSALLEAQLNSTADGILVVDNKSKRIVHNQTMIHLLDLPPEIAESSDDQKRYEWIASQVINPRQYSDKVAYLYAHPDEVCRDELEFTNGKYLDRYSAPVRGKDGTYYGRIWSFHDITDLKLAQLSLRESQARYGSLVENMLEGYAFCRLLFEEGEARDLIYLEVNSAFETLTGLKDVLGKKISEVIPGILETNPEVFETYVRVALTGVAEQIETHVKLLGIWFSISVYSHLKEHFTVVFENITERKRNESRMRQLVDSNVQGVIFWKRNGGIIGANDAFLRLVGHTREDLETGRINWMALTPPEYAQLDRRALEEIAATGISSPYEKEFLLRDGSRVPVLLGSAAFEDNPDEGVCYFIDLTERKKLEHQFLRAQRMESIGTLAGGIAHDLNNILAPITMSIHLLKDAVSDPQSKDILETIEVSAKRGADIVRQVLTFARGVEGERLEIQPNHLVKDLESIIKDTFPKDIRMRFSIPSDTWSILGDPTQVHQILLNLCVNARDAMPNGGNLTVGIENCVLDEHYSTMNIEAKPGRYVNISVTDTGTGMPPALIDKIFDPFFTTKELNKGTGLGLSTVMAIIKSHEGLVNVYSEPGKGTTFKVYLPAIEVASDALKALTGKVSLRQGKGETVLVVDDEASILNITKRTLQASGYLVLTATDGADALAVYLEHKDQIAVVLTDMMMPVMDGPAMIHALKRINPDVKIIAASGLNANGGSAKAPLAGVTHFLTKPYTARILLNTIQAIIDEA